MKKLLLILHFSFLILNYSFAQPSVQWQKCFGGSASEEAEFVQQTNDGGFIVAGYGNSFDGDTSGKHGNDDFWILKLDDNGAVQWKKSLGGSGNEYARCIQQTLDGGYIVAGETSSGGGDIYGNHGVWDYWIVKLDDNGDFQWKECLGGSAEDVPFSLQQTNDSGYIISGLSSSNNGDVTGNHGMYDYSIIKLTSNGAIQWQKSLGGSGMDVAYSIQQTTDGGYIIAGLSSSNDGDVSGNHGVTDCWIVKLYSNGDIQWKECLGGSNEERAFCIRQAEGGYIIAGFTNSNNGDISGNHGGKDCWIIKLNTNGSIQWKECLGGSGDDIAYSIQQTTDGGYIMAGLSSSNNGNVSGNHGDWDYWIVKLNSAGAIQWQKSLGGSGQDAAYSIQQTADEGYIVAGFTYSTDGDVIGNHGMNDFWVLKLSHVVGYDALPLYEDAFRISPNPATNQLTVRTSSILSNEPVTVVIINVLGDKILTCSPLLRRGAGGEAVIDISKLPAGIYFVHVIGKNDDCNGKFVKE